MTTTTTLNHYNKKNKRRNNTQRKKTRSHGGYNDFGPGKVYHFDKGNMRDLDRLMRQTKVPIIFRHTDKECPHCTRFEEPWSEIEEITQYPPQSHSVASVYPIATDYIVDNYPDYPRVNGFPTVVLVNKDGVPVEHTGPNTLEAIQDFLDKNGLKIVQKDQERDQLRDADADADADDFGAAGLGAAGLGAAGLGAGLGAAGLGAGAPYSSESVAHESVVPESVAPFTPESVAPESVALESVTPESVAPESVASSTLKNVKETVSNIDAKIQDGLNALTEPIDFNKMFGVKSDANAAQATAQTDADVFPPAPVNAQVQKPPQMPSNGGKGRSKKGKKSLRRHKNKSASRRKHSTRRKSRK